MKQGQAGFSELFNKFRDSIMRVDPVYFCSKYLTIDGKPLDLEASGYKPFADIYRYIGISALEPESKPIVLVKGRQVGATTMAAALECYFAASGLFGTNDRPPMRMIHLFPTLSLAAAYTKDKFDSILGNSKPVPGAIKANGLLKSYMESMLDTTSPTNNNMHFKKFQSGNQLWIESTGIDGNRIRGRQLCLETELPTPTGFIKLKDLKEGDELFDEKGDICHVIKLYPIQETPEAYRVFFDDGTTVDACAEHLWSTHTKNERIIKNINKIPTVKNTKEILNTLTIKCGNGKVENNHSIPICLPLRYPAKELLIDPYLLGLWLGHGNRYGCIETEDPEILNNFQHKIIKSSINHKSNWEISKSNSYRIIGLTTALRKLGLAYTPDRSGKFANNGFYHKKIPDQYMYSSFEQRLALLQGLMDSYGCSRTDGRSEFVQSKYRKKLVYQVRELIQSLGIKTSLYNVKYQDRYRIQFYTTLPVFRLNRKFSNIKTQLKKSNKRFITNIEPIQSKPMRCITVDSTSHLYLITKSFIPTHNTCDLAAFDECFPYQQCIATENGKEKIGNIVNLFLSKRNVPRVLSYNETLDVFEYKNVTNAWKKEERELVKIYACNRTIKCTPNHRFLTTNGWVQSKDLLPGTLIKSTSPKLGQISYDLNDDQKQIMLGSFLGDGYIHNHGRNRFRLSIIQDIKQREYCEWKASVFGSTTVTVEKNGYSQKPAIKFNTKLFASDKNFGLGKKTTCPQWILDSLDERGLSIWFMDHGSVSSNNYGVINTCSFDEDSQQRIVRKLEDFGIKSQYKYYKTKSSFGKGYFSIYINKENLEILQKLISPYVHESMSYKISGTNSYVWNSNYPEYGIVVVDRVEYLDKKEVVYDLEVEDNHNFIATSVKTSKNCGGVIAHNCQDISDQAVGAVTKILAQSRYGKRGEGVQVYFGTPKTKGGSYWNMWKKSSQNYFHLRCEKCGKFFPLYRPDTKWEDIWIYGHTVKCPDCGCEQNKLEAQERGKWIPLNNPDECDYVGYHINQLYIPGFYRETIESAKPEHSPINTERIYMNEVLGEFYDGEGGTITGEEIRNKCIDPGRKMAQYITSDKNGKRVYAGFDWGQRGLLEQLSGKGGGRKGSYSCAVIITADANLFNVEFATRLMTPSPEEKESTIEEMFRRYNMKLAVGDIGDAFDLTHKMQRTYDERFLASRSSHKVLGHVKFSRDEWPKTIVFEKDYYISEMLGLLKEGRIKFPGGHQHKIGWLIDHCASMDIKVTKDKSGEPIKKYVKGTGANDGLMALLNAYLAWKFDITQGFTIANPLHMKYEIAQDNRSAQAVLGYVPGMLGGRR